MAGRVSSGRGGKSSGRGGGGGRFDSRTKRGRADPGPQSEEERRAATARMQAGRVSARVNAEAEFFWNCVRREQKWRDGAPRQKLSLQFDLAQPLGLAFHAEDLTVTGCFEGQAAKQLLLKAGPDGVLDSDEGDAAAAAEAGGSVEPASTWRIKGVGGIAVSDGPDFVAALQRCRDRYETSAFVQLEETAPGAAQAAAQERVLFGAINKKGSSSSGVGSDVTSYDTAPVAREGVLEKDVPPLADFAALAGDWEARLDAATAAAAAAASAAADAATEEEEDLVANNNV